MLSEKNNGVYSLIYEKKILMGCKTFGALLKGGETKITIIRTSSQILWGQIYCCSVFFFFYGDYDQSFQCPSMMRSTIVQGTWEYELIREQKDQKVVQ